MIQFAFMHDEFALFSAGAKGEPGNSYHAPQQCTCLASSLTQIHTNMHAIK